MWMSELSTRSGVPIATIKYYLRDGLLPPGESTGATRARYSEAHVGRLRLIRALVEVGGLPLERVRRVLGALDDRSASLHEVVAIAHGELSPEPARPPSEAARSAVHDLVAERGWQVSPDSRHALALAAALDALDAAGQPMSAAALEVYADSAARVAAAEIAGMREEDRAGAAAYAITGTVLAEPVLTTLRRLAHEDASNRRFS